MNIFRPSSIFLTSSLSKRLLGLAPPSPSRPVQILPRIYHENVIDHYNNPRNVGSFDKNDPNVGTDLVGAPACGDVMKLQIKIDEKTGKIVDACFKTFGCGSTIASSSVEEELCECDNLDFSCFRLSATEWVKGKSTEEVLTIKNTEIAKHLALPPVKLHCSMLAKDAIKAAVKDLEAKRAKLNGRSDACVYAEKRIISEDLLHKSLTRVCPSKAIILQNQLDKDKMEAGELKKYYVEDTLKKLLASRDV